jgi:hypothetical protein
MLLEREVNVHLADQRRVDAWIQDLKESHRIEKEYLLQRIAALESVSGGSRRTLSRRGAPGVSLTSRSPVSSSYTPEDIIYIVSLMTLYLMRFLKLLTLYLLTTIAVLGKMMLLHR